MKRLVLMAGLFLLHSYGVALARPNSANDGFYYLSPVPNAQMVSPHAKLIFRPGAELREQIPDWMSRVEVTGRSSGSHGGRWVYARDGRTFIFEPHQPFQRGETVAVRLRSGDPGSAGLRDVAYSFTVSACTAEPPAPQLDDPPVETEPPMRARRLTHKKRRCGPPPADYTLPDDFPEIDVTRVDDPSRGVLFVSAFGPGGASNTTYMMILNDAGQPLFFRGSSDNIFLDFKKQPDGRLSYFDYAADQYYFLDRSYTVVDSIRCQGYATDIHDVQLLPNGNFLIMGLDRQTVDMSTLVEGGDPEAFVDALIVQEQDADRNVVFEWRSWDHIDILDADHVDFTASRVDYVHANSIELDDDGNIMVSCRHLSAVLKINRDDGNVMWWLGGKHNDFTLLGDDQWFSHQHSCRRQPGGTITIFDNARFTTPPASRAVEYQMDEVNRTITLVWSFVHDPAINGSAMGNVQRLADGNTVIGWGYANPNVTEVRPNGSTAFEMTFPDGVFTYRAFRHEWNGEAATPFLWSTGGDQDLQLNFTWFGVEGVKGYDIYRSDAGGPFLPAGRSDGNRFVVHGFTAGETLRFKVKAVTHGGRNNPFSNTISVTPAFDDAVITASLEIHPRALNPRSRGGWVEARIELPDECNCGPRDVDVSSIRLNQTVPAAGRARVTHSRSGVIALVKFDREAVVGALDDTGDVEVTGSVGTRTFAGYDRIRILGPGSEEEHIAGPGDGRPPVPLAEDADPAGRTPPTALLGAVPNPFNPSTRIRYSVGTGGGAVDIRVFDVAGRLVRTLIDAQQPAGARSVVWDGRDEHGRNVASGVYFCRMRCADYVQTHKIVLAK